MKLASVEQLTYSEFMFSLVNPTCFNVLRCRPIIGQIVLDVQPSILYPIIDRLLGGGREKTPIVHRPLTEIELRLASRITTLFLQELVKAWREVADLELMIDRVESDPQAVEAAPANEAVAVLRFPVSINDSQGSMSLCLPWPWLGQIAGRLAVSTWAMRARGTSRRPGQRSVKRSASIRRRVGRIAGRDQGNRWRAVRSGRWRYHHYRAGCALIHHPKREWGATVSRVARRARHAQGRANRRSARSARRRLTSLAPLTS